MAKRLLNYTPSELTNLNKQDFLDAIRISEGRTVCAYVCPRAANYVENVSNVEMVASFGADFIMLEGFDPYKMQMTGLPSKNRDDDKQSFRDLQIEMGFGWSIRELKKLTGRPIGLYMIVREYEGQEMYPLMADTVYSPELLEFVIKEGYDFVSIVCLKNDILLKAIKEASSIAKDRIVIEASVPHGPGEIDGESPPYNLRKILTPEFVRELAEAGADIIDIPTVGILPSYTMDYMSKLADAIHDGKSLVAGSVCHSIEAANESTISKIVLDNKACGIDMINIGGGGVWESATLPEALMSYCIATKGKRHTYRRMCQSPLR